jgi:hypothetical protein
MAERWRIVMTVGLLAGLVVASAAQLGVASAAQPTARSVAATEVRPITPLEANGHLAARYTVAHEYAGANCVSGSPTTGTSYECFSSRSPQGVFESCWAQASPDYAICLENPWTHHAIRLHVTGGYDDREGFTRVSIPWGPRLGASIRCLVDPGEVRTADGHAVTYKCTGHIVLVGSPRRTAPTWRINAYRRIKHHHAATTYTPLGSKPVTVSWKGQPSRVG